MSAAVILSTAAEIGNVNIGSNAADVRLDMTGTNSRAHTIGASAGETWAILVSGNECVLDDVNTGSGLGDSCIEVTGQRAAAFQHQVELVGYRVRSADHRRRLRPQRAHLEHRRYGTGNFGGDPLAGSQRERPSRRQ